MSETDMRAQPGAGKDGDARYNGGKSWPVLRTLRELRLDAGLSLTGLQDASGVNRAIISQIERGRMAGTRDELDRISVALGFPAGAIEMRLVAVREEPGS